MGVGMKSELLPVEVSQKSVIAGVNGNVLHTLKETDGSFKRFGDYFSTINYGQIKGWKRHRLMTCNLFVPLVKLCSQYLTIEDKVRRQFFPNIHCPGAIWLSDGCSNDLGRI